MVRNGISTRLFLSPGADNVRLVIRRLVKDIVVLIPDKITVIIAISCAPIPVKRTFDENGVIKVQPDMVKDELLDFGRDFFFSRLVFNCVVMYHILSETLVRFCKITPFIGKSKILYCPRLESLDFSAVWL